MMSSRLALETGPEIMCSPTRSVRSSHDCQRTLCIATIAMTVVTVITFLVLVGILVGSIEPTNFENDHKNQVNKEKLENGSKTPKQSVTEYSNRNGVKNRALEGDLIFEENFDSLDLDVWQHEITMSGGGNWEFQLYHNNRSNSYVNNGTLFIKPNLTSDQYGEAFLTSGEIQLGGGAPADSCTNPSFFGCQRRGTPTNILNPITSARIRTINSFAFKYGKVNVRAKLPLGDWLWPAIWLMPKTNNYGGWPASGEIDILEGRGNTNLINDQNVSLGVDQFGSTLHFGPYWPLNGWDKAHFEKHLKASQSFDQDFHIFGFEWTPENMTFSVDGETVGTVSPPEKDGFWGLGGFGDSAENPWMYSSNSKMAPFDQQFYLIINLAVGGTNGYFPDNVQNSGKEKPWKNSSPQAMLDFWNARSDWLPTWEGEGSALQVDYVRVWAL